MATNIMDIRGLSELHARDICQSPEDWMGYLDTAARFYHSPFYDAFLIHAQRPNAQFCASMEDWNQNMRRWVNRGAIGIALIDDRGRRPRLKYVFDIKDTHPTQGAKKIYRWKMDYKKERPVKDYIESRYGVKAKGSMPMAEVFKELAKILTAENIRQAMYDLDKNRGNSYLATMGEAAILNQFTRLIEESVSYVLMKRCSYHPLEHMDIGVFEAARIFDDISVLPYLGEAVHTITEPVLSEIGAVIADYDRQELKKEMEAAPIEGQVSFVISQKDLYLDLDEITKNGYERQQKTEFNNDVQDLARDESNRIKSGNGLLKQNQNSKQGKEDIYGRTKTYRISEVRGVPLPETDSNGKRNEDTKELEPDGGRAGVAGLSEGKTPSGLRHMAIDGETSRLKESVGEIVATTLTLPLLPVPGAQRDVIENGEKPMEKDSSRSFGMTEGDGMTKEDLERHKDKEECEDKDKGKGKNKNQNKNLNQDQDKKQAKASVEKKPGNFWEKPTGLQKLLAEKKKQADVINKKHAKQTAKSKSKEAVL